jgi:hypothetical protein
MNYNRHRTFNGGKVAFENTIAGLFELYVNFIYILLIASALLRDRICLKFYQKSDEKQDPERIQSDLGSYNIRHEKVLSYLKKRVDVLSRAPVASVNSRCLAGMEMAGA